MIDESATIIYISSACSAQIGVSKWASSSSSTEFRNRTLLGSPNIRKKFASCDSVTATNSSSSACRPGPNFLGSLHNSSEQTKRTTCPFFRKSWEDWFATFTHDSSLLYRIPWINGRQVRVLCFQTLESEIVKFIKAVIDNKLRL